ncbi:hypothetical protein RPB_1916 [Rhodopseudomonas palustris HaA2]|uniref:Uncharacterized protein n=2 Tax=Rhodopseudomonas palustris TaxID=1076 RepID=Q2IYT6_RHOP2|nr:hypothetical protein RPB_1916 [Rhodopseudomonas palustris HaA2]
MSSRDGRRRRNEPEMLPGVRFLFAAVVLAVSMLVFGLGAAALLRAAHEQFASGRSSRPAQIALALRPAEPAMPTLSLLRVEPPAAEPVVPDEQSIAAPPVQATESAPQAAVTSVPESAETATPDTTIATPPAAELKAPDNKAPDQTAGPAAGSVVAEQDAQPGANQQPAMAPAATSEPSATASAIDTAAKPEPAHSEAARVEAEKPTATATEQLPAAASVETATPQPADSAPAANDLPQVTALTGPIPTPKRDPRPTIKPIVQSPGQPAGSGSAATVDPAAKPADPESTGSIGDPASKAEQPKVMQPKADKPAKTRSKINRRRQAEERRRRPVVARPSSEESPFGLPPT